MSYLNPGIHKTRDKFYNSNGKSSSCIYSQWLYWRIWIRNLMISSALWWKSEAQNYNQLFIVNTKCIPLNRNVNIHILSHLTSLKEDKYKSDNFWKYRNVQIGTNSMTNFRVSGQKFSQMPNTMGFWGLYTLYHWTILKAQHYELWLF